MLFWPSVSFFPSSNTNYAPVLRCYRALCRTNGGSSQGLLIQTEKRNTAKYIVYKSRKHLLASHVALISPLGWDMISIRSEGRLFERDLEHWSELVIRWRSYEASPVMNPDSSGPKTHHRVTALKKEQVMTEKLYALPWGKNYTFINWKVHKYHRHHLNPQKRHDTYWSNPHTCLHFWLHLWFACLSVVQQFCYNCCRRHGNTTYLSSTVDG